MLSHEEFFSLNPKTIVAECHRLLFLQMACEKLCKAYLIQGGTFLDAVQKRHGYVAKPLRMIIEQQIIHMTGNLYGKQGVLEHVRHLSQEIELLNPAVRRDGRRLDNCEYPWEVGDRLISPLDWSFDALRLSTVPAGRSFLKLLRGSIDRLLAESGRDD